MERKFIVLGVFVVILALSAAGIVGWYTFSRLGDAGPVLEEEDYRVYKDLVCDLSDETVSVRAQISQRSSLKDYARFAGFSGKMLAGMEFVSHEYLYTAEGDTPRGEETGDFSISLTFYRSGGGGVLHSFAVLWDRAFHTDFSVREESARLWMDGELFRVQYRGASFTVRCPETSAWILSRAGT